MQPHSDPAGLVNPIIHHSPMALISKSQADGMTKSGRRILSSPTAVRAGVGSTQMHNRSTPKGHPLARVPLHLVTPITHRGTSHTTTTTTTITRYSMPINITNSTSTTITITFPDHHPDRPPDHHLKDQV
mmetsp:Transcript_70481/g.124190  ORF Transcript_70481/g.124190 Transcript_70481/m.124190 type:complete len:130 (-) Transcript_70481:243-632(-)